MQADILQSTAFTWVFKLYLTDHITPATGKTVAVTLSKNTAAFGNPSVGASNATEIANGWYYFTSSTTDTATLGPVIWLGTATGCDNADQAYQVVKATNRGMTAVPDTAVTTNASLITSGTSTDQLSVTAGKVAGVVLVDTLTTYTGNTVQTGDSFARIGATGSGLTSLAPSSTALSTATWTNTRAGYLDNLSGGAVALASGVVLTSAGLDLVVIETGLNARQSLSIIAASVAGTSSGVNAGSPIYKGAGVATTRITATAASGDRSAVTLFPPA